MNVKMHPHVKKHVQSKIFATWDAHCHTVCQSNLSFYITPQNSILFFVSQTCSTALKKGRNTVKISLKKKEEYLQGST